MGAGILSTPASPGSTPTQNPKSKSMIYKILKQNNLYHNPDPLFQLVGEVNKSTVVVEGQEARALLDSGSSVVSYFIGMSKEIEIQTTTIAINFYKLKGQGS